jgi:hypothetical protein
MDQYLLQLASYESSQGLMVADIDKDGIKEFQEKIANNFNRFKKMIQTSECTLDDLEQMVLTRYGPVPNPYHGLSMSETLDKIADEVDEHESSDDEVLDALADMDALISNYLKGMSFVDGPSLLKGLDASGGLEPFEIPTEFIPHDDIDEEIKTKKAPKKKAPKKAPKKKAPTKKVIKKKNEKNKESE